MSNTPNPTPDGTKPGGSGNVNPTPPPPAKRPEDLTAADLAAAPDVPNIDLQPEPLAEVGQAIENVDIDGPPPEATSEADPELDAPELTPPASEVIPKSWPTPDPQPTPPPPSPPPAPAPKPAAAAPRPAPASPPPPAAAPAQKAAPRPGTAPAPAARPNPAQQPAARPGGGVPVGPRPGAPRPAATGPRPQPKAPAPPPPPPAPPPPPKPPPEWKVLEPDDPSDPVEHEVFEAGAGRPGWQVVASSVRGKLHAHKASWREDSYKWATADAWTIIAVSDGAGSSRLSRIASRVACEASVTHLRQLLAGYVVAPGEQQPGDGDLQRLRSLLADAGGKARMAIMVEAQRRSAPIKDFSATLLVAAHTPWQDRDLVVALQVGDGAIGLATASGHKRLGISDHGEYSSETRFLTTPGIELEFHNRVLFSLPTGLNAIALMTDGVSDDFFPEDKRIGEVFDANPIDGVTAKGGGPVFGLLHGVAKDPRGGEALRDWLRYEKRGSSDDRTLVLMHRSAT